MCSLSELAGNAVGQCCENAVKKLARHVNYIFQYKKNMKELEDEKVKLEKQMGKNEGEVEAAKTQGEIVKEDVVEWAEMAKTIKREVGEFIDAKAICESMKCLNFSCPNLIKRYQMSKKSEQRIRDLKEHIQVGNFNRVACPAPPPPELQFPSSGDFVRFDSREPLLKRIKDGLVNPSVNMIGVYGTGGVGKTAVVTEVGKQMREDGTFDEIVFAAVSQNVNICTIQGKIADRLTMMELKSKTEEGRANELWNRLNNGKNNLVILDDLWQKLDLKAIGIPLRHGNKGCKVILTTRDLDVLRKMEADKCISVMVLSDDESWNLFKKKLDTAFISDELRRLAVLVCKQCSGLPVAILAVREALAGKEDIHDWNDALDQLQNSSWEKIAGIDQNMYLSLKLSYDYLGKEAQSILLLCCLYPEDADIPVDFLVFHSFARGLLGQSKDKVEKARARTFTLVNFLKTRSLLLDGFNENFVKMHDVVRDVVLSIAKNEKQYLFKDAIDEWPKDYINDSLAAVSIRSNKLNEVPNELACPQLHTLRIECTDSSFQFPDNIFSGTRELRILELKGIRMLKCPSSIENLSELRTLILIDCELEDMSFLERLKSSLQVLVIESYSIEALPLELGELSNLHVLLLNGCYRLQLIPAGVISKLTHLEELRLPSNFDFCGELSGSKFKDVEISRATLSELSSLTRLTSLSVFISDATLIPDLRFDNLVSYKLEVGSCFLREPLRRKNLKLVGMTYNDKLGTLLERDQVLYLESVEGLENVFPDRVGKGFSELESLVIKDCSFKSLFTSSCAKGLSKLETLAVWNCNHLEEIIKTEGEEDEFNDMVHLNKLKTLVLYDLPKLISFGPKKVKKNDTAEGDHQPFFNEKVTFRLLKDLNISNCSSITEIWDKKVTFPLLKTLYILDCSSITEIWSQEVHPTNSFPQLVRVNVFKCPKLVNVFPSNMLPSAQNLNEISIGSCNGVEFVVSTTGVAEESYKTVNNEKIVFPNLSSIQLTDLENLKSFCGSSTTSEPHYLFNPQVTFPLLKTLYISDCSSITEIWSKEVHPTNSFPQLVRVNVFNCPKLVNVFPSNMLPSAQNLNEILIGSCNGVEFVVFTTGVAEESYKTVNNEKIVFPNLSSIRLTDLENLRSFCGSSTTSEPHYLFNPQVQFPALRRFYLKKLPNLETVEQQMSKGELQVNFPILEYGYIDDRRIEGGSVCT